MFEGFKELREKAKKAPSVAQSIRGGQKESIEKGYSKPYPVLDTDTYIFESEKIERHVPEIRNAIQTMKKDGSPVFGVDLMGQGRPCISMGCDSALALCLETGQDFYDANMVTRLRENNVSLSYGDVFDMKTAREFMQCVSNQVQGGQKLGIAYFRPCAGIWNYERTMTDFAFPFLYKYYLKPIYQLLEENGAIFAQLTFSMDRDPDLSRRFSGAVREKLFSSGFNLVEYSDIYHTFLLVKPKFDKWRNGG